MFLQLVSVSGVVQNFETYIYSAVRRHSSFMMQALSHSRWYIVSHQREVFPGLDSGPNCSEGHYFYTLEKRPSGDSLYTTDINFTFTVKSKNMNVFMLATMFSLIKCQTC